MKTLTAKERRTFRTRRAIARPVATDRLRLSVFRSAKHVYAQIIDDAKGVTVAEANSKSLAPTGRKTDQAKAVGQALAERALAAGIRRVVFDRGPYRYHGRVKALAEGAREGGLEF
ncbi:MAG: 50S ribosomal protein L18 [Trueperaceae bacterium]|jgi:large subunit ribosomal protein L18|nr:50S ribosomal protein L18 [Trueperaceae bacterium]